MKPTVYVDTNILSLLYVSSADPEMMRQSGITHDWWECERQHFRVFASQAVDDELADGRYPGQERALKCVRRLPYLGPRSAIRDISAKVLATGILPETEVGDALQLAIATAHSIDYLLSWNRAHLVNPITQAKLAHFRAAWGWRTPLVVTPESIPSVRLGQSIRRRD
ncbi:MAG TPA: hypothetical protein VGP72_02845 [Planctomycetota bacterium]|jgi:predicted nucleic acid-binding protein